MTSTPIASQASSQSLDLPPGFESLMQIREMETPRLKSKPMVNVIGFVKDYQPPIETRGSDYKCTMELMDHSIANESFGIKLVIFWDAYKMPKISGPGDIVLARNVKAQMWDGIPSFLANHGSEFHILSKTCTATTILKAGALWTSYPPNTSKKPSITETSYVIWANNHISNLILPTSQEFHDKSLQALNAKDKFSLLQDVKADKFHNIIAEVVRIWDRGGTMLTMYVSDYSANSKFYNYCWGGQAQDKSGEGREGDEYGYLKTELKVEKDWLGPYGKLTIQLTLFDSHAEFARDHVKVNNWVLLKNVRFKQQRDNLELLEGVLRQDRDAFEGKVQVQVMKQAAEPDDNDERWKAGLRRKHEWQKKFEAQKMKILDEQTNPTATKREREGQEPVKNSRQRRKERRAAAEGRVNKLDLNENVRCQNPDIPTSSLGEILQPCLLYVQQESNKQEVIAPFTVAKYRANVRVIDYFPPDIQDFAVGRRVSEFDMLSNYSGGEETDPEEDMRSFRAGKGYPEKTWVWRFALKVEDAEPSESSKEQMWLLVDNEAAQGLLNLDQDATNLYRDQSTLQGLKEQLFKLWGELEEQKSASIIPKKIQPRSSLPPPSSSVIPSSPLDIGGMPDPDSGDDEPPCRSISTLKEKDINLPSQCDNDAGKEKAKIQGKKAAEIKNKAFTCCIKQYGIKVTEEDPRKADAGKELRWERRFGMFGVTIA